jgi:Glycosyl hydrolases family 2, TIM barrel domain/Glycosyl hydrolases family 2, sugar binding domain/Glycosyl hydrolases family 2
MQLGGGLLAGSVASPLFNTLVSPGQALADTGAPGRPVSPNPVWPRPVIVPVPDETVGVSTAVRSLNGTWKFTASPPAGFWSTDVDPSSWADAAVPGQLTMQGFAIVADVESAYKTKIHIPHDAAGRRVLLQFDAVYSSARVWVDGQFVRDHSGGFTTWDADITPFVRPGQDAWLTVGVTDRSDDISRASSYASTPLGGILRDVRLLVLPTDHLTRFDVETHLDPTYTNAVLRVFVAASLQQSQGVTVRLRLHDPRGASVSLSPDTVDLTRAQPEVAVDIPVPSPRLWDAEHPYLYTLEATEYASGAPLERVSRRIGFRQVEVRGNKLLVNGREVKLRGADHHHISPTGGRSTSAAIDDQDIALLRAANVNFLRTSHYPPTPALLAAADEYGIYIDEETAVTWALTQNDPRYRARYLDQFAEMIARDRSHPSVIMWSLGNESAWGTNFASEYDYAKAEDPSRPAISSDGGINASNPALKTDLFSIHYPDPAQTYSREKPVLYDEYAPIAAFWDVDEQSRDPDVHSYWGASIKALWEHAFTSEGVLGGGIWAAIDDVMLLPNGPGSYGEWGLIDVWRRERPEYWLAAKGYSPVRVADAPLTVSRNEPLQLPVSNWFDATNLNELRVEWRIGDESGSMAGPDVAPRGQGTLTVPARRWEPGSDLSLRFYRRGHPVKGSADLFVDAFDLPTREAANSPVQRALPSRPAPTLEQDSSRIRVSGTGFSVTFSTQTGLITDASYKGTTIVHSGPYLNLVGGAPLASWRLDAIDARVDGGVVVVDIGGRYGAVVVRFTVTIDANALLTTSYVITNPPAGSYSEVGVTYVVPDAVDRLTWRRHALWSVYPGDHIGRPAGVAPKERTGGHDQYGARPAWPWSLDMKDFALFGTRDPDGRGTNDFRSSKEGIIHASAVLGGSQVRLRAESAGSDAVRLETAAVRLGPCPCGCQRCVDDSDPSIVYKGTWYHQQNAYSSAGYRGTWSISQTAGDSATLTFTGTSIKWIADTQFNMGMADVYLDGGLVAHDVDLFSPLNDRGGTPPQGGHYQQVLYGRSGLPNGQHTIEIVVTGHANPQAQGAWVNIDAFAVDGPPDTGVLPPAGIAFIQNNYLAFPELAYGNISKGGLTIPANYTNSVRQRLTDSDDE